MIGIVHPFELIDSRTFGLPLSNGHLPTHLATVKWGLREFIYYRLEDGQTYIEEIIARPTLKDGKIVAYYKFIDDDNLWQALANFLQEKGLTDMATPFKSLKT